MMTEKHITVTKRNSRERLDKFLKQEFFSYSRGEIVRNIQAGNVLVNRKKVKPSYTLKAGDKISLRFRVQSSKLIPNPNLEIRIIYQDKNIVVINKPAGLQVHPDSKEKFNTVVNWLIYKFPEIKEVVDLPLYSGIDDVYTINPALRPGIVHRLDKDTSGVMVIARNIRTFQELKKLFKKHEAEKKYLALVYGILKSKKGRISKPIARAATYRRQVVAGRKTKTKVREAVTEYKVLKEFDNYSLLEVTPQTGRMHQIRVHLFSVGHPIVGDKIYRLKRLPNSRLSLEIPRQMLHAQSLKFRLFGKNYSFSSSAPKDFQKIQKSLEK